MKGWNAYLKNVRSCIKKFEFSDKDLAIAAIDGSKSISMSNRLNMKVVVLSVGALILKNNIREEKFEIYSIKGKAKILRCYSFLPLKLNSELFGKENR